MEKPESFVSFTDTVAVATWERGRVRDWRWRRRGIAREIIRWTAVLVLAYLKRNANISDRKGYGYVCALSHRGNRWS